MEQDLVSLMQQMQLNANGNAQQQRGGRGGGGGGDKKDDGSAQHRAEIDALIDALCDEHVGEWVLFDVSRYRHRDGSVTVNDAKQLCTARRPNLSAIFVCGQCGNKWPSAKCSIDLTGPLQPFVTRPRCTRLWRQDCQRCGTAAWPDFRRAYGGPNDGESGGGEPKRWAWLRDNLDRTLAIMARQRVEDVERDPGADDNKKPHQSELCEVCRSGQPCTAV